MRFHEIINHKNVESFSFIPWKAKKFCSEKKIRVSEGIILKFVLSEEWDLILKHRASEIRVKRIRVNQGLGVHDKWEMGTFLNEVLMKVLCFEPAAFWTCTRRF